MERLHKILAQAGIGSRRACEVYIQEGRVQVDGETIRDLGLQLEPEEHTISFDGEPIQKEKVVYYLLNKPKGVLCTNDAKDPRPKVTQLIRERRRIFPVGRLDADTEGIILLTNDGDLANKLAHPRYEMQKTYFVKVRGKITSEELEIIQKGVWLDVGKAAIPKVRLERTSSQFSSLTITVREGKNRMIRRVFAKVQHPVMVIRRIRIGPITIKGLPTGRYRYLTPQEVKLLFEEIENPRTKPVKSSRPPSKREKEKKPSIPKRKISYSVEPSSEKESSSTKKYSPNKPSSTRKKPSFGASSEKESSSAKKYSPNKPSSTRKKSSFGASSEKESSSTKKYSPSKPSSTTKKSSFGKNPFPKNSSLKNKKNFPKKTRD